MICLLQINIGILLGFVFLMKRLSRDFNFVLGYIILIARLSMKTYTLKLVSIVETDRLIIIIPICWRCLLVEEMLGMYVNWGHNCLSVYISLIEVEV